jgi:hypothetical protein
MPFTPMMMMSFTASNTTSMFAANGKKNDIGIGGELHMCTPTTPTSSIGGVHVSVAQVQWK